MIVKEVEYRQVSHGYIQIIIMKSSNNYTSNYSYQKTISTVGGYNPTDPTSSSSFSYRTQEKFGTKSPSYTSPPITESSYSKSTLSNVGGLPSSRGNVGANTTFTTNSFSTSSVGNAGSGVTDREGAKGVARRIMETYDRDKNGVIDNVEVVPMIVDAYKSFNRVFSPSSTDIESYLKIISRNGDGKVTAQDVEGICSRYLTSRI